MAFVMCALNSTLALTAVVVSVCDGVEGQPPQRERERERERRVAAATRRYLGGKPERREYLRTVKLNIKTCIHMQ